MPKDSLNILVLSNCAFDEFQGSGYVIVNTMRCLEKLGHRVSGADNATLPVARWMGGRANRYRMALGMAKYVWQNRRRLPATDLVIFYGAECFLALWCLQYLTNFKGKTILHSNGIEMLVDEAMMAGSLQVNRYSKVFQWNMHPLLRYAYRRVNLLLAVSKYNADYALGRLKMPAEKVAMLEPCLDEAYFDESNHTGVAREQVVMYCGGWLPIKGVHFLQKAMCTFMEENPGYRLLLVGVGEHFKKETFFPEHLLHRILVKGYLRNRKELIDCYHTAQIFIFPSLADSFGLVVAEAMQCGAAVITGKTGFGYSLQHGREAWLAEPLTAEALVTGLQELAWNDGLRQTLVEQGGQRVNHLRWSIYTKALGKVLEQLFPPNQFEATL